MVEYTCDAWGNLLSITGEEASTVGIANPLRYRGYCYDAETGLYYLSVGGRYFEKIENNDICSWACIMLWRL